LNATQHNRAMELDEADNMLVIEALDEDESVEEGVNKRAKVNNKKRIWLK
jgi:uncharacterized protein (DUF1778 family)